MNAEAILGMLTPATYFILLGIEAIWPARQFPIRFWRLTGIAFVAVLMTIGIMTPLLLPVEWLAAHRLLDGSRLGVPGGVIVGLVVSELVGYGIHRSAHRVSFLWRFMHQVHHWAERIDVASSAVFHPTEVILQNLLGVGLGSSCWASTRSRAPSSATWARSWHLPAPERAHARVGSGTS